MRVLIVLLFSLATIVVKAHTSSFFISGDTIRIIDTNTQIVNKNSHYVLKIKDLFPDLFFYNSAGTKVYSDSIFNKGRSVIFAVGSYTCPLFRNSLKQLNKYLDSQKTQSDIYFVYVQEAHPIKGSPYGEAHDNIELNKRENISIHQQKNIEDRIS